METVLGVLSQPEVVDVVVSVVGLAATWALARFSRWTGVKIDAETRAYFEKALDNGVRLMLQTRGTSGDVAEYLAGTVPDAMRRLGITDEQVAKLVASRLAAAAPTDLEARS